MATTVKGAFDEYKTNLELTDKQTNLVSTRRANVEKALAGELTLHPDRTKVIGSWDRTTLTRYLSEGDVDVLVVMNYGAHKEWHNADGTIKCLDRFKSILQGTYPSTTMRRDRNCISIAFSEFRLDVVPAFKYDSGDYMIPDSIRKQWVATNPFTFASNVTELNSNISSRYVPLIKMVKGWNREAKWPIRSFHLECMLYNHCKSWNKVYDWGDMIQDFFQSLPSYVDGAAYDPVKGDRVDTYLDNNSAPTRRATAKTKATDAAAKSKEAYNDQEKYPSVSIKEWKALLGEFFPSYG